MPSDLEDLLAFCSMWVHHQRELFLDQWFSISTFSQMMSMCPGLP